jgi:hypothetical protein
MNSKQIVLLVLLLCSSVYGGRVITNAFGPNAVTNNGLIYEVISTNEPEPVDRFREPRLSFTTPAYNQEAFRLLLLEANDMAQRLKLPERLPITEKEIVERFIVPYGITRHRPMIGTVRTKDYAYYVSVGYKLSYVEGTHQDEDSRKWLELYKWPRSRIDTNAAYQLATQWLAAASMDVAALNRDCTVRIELNEFWNNANSRKKTTFIPMYVVSWLSPENVREGVGHAASVQLFAPTKTLISLKVEESQYILRKPLVFRNLNALLGDSYKLPDATR